MELSRQKCEEVAGRIKESGIVLGADTIVAVHGKVLGKPEDEQDAVRMLRELQGNTHQVFTGVTIIWRSEEEILCKETFFEKTDVTFYPMNEEEIIGYVRTKEPMDKAGAYAIQGFFAQYIKGIVGDYYNVVGLPLAHLMKEMHVFLS